MMDQQFTPENATVQWIAVLLLAGIVMVCGPRKWVLPIFLTATVFWGLQNRVYIFGMNFFTARILLLFAWARVIARGEYQGLQILPLDKAFILFSIWSLLTETIQRGTAGAVYGTANYIYDALGTYFLGRVLLADARMPQLRQIIRVLAVICSLLAAFMIAEYLSRRNWLSILGTAFEEVQEREGHLRCQATFQHAVLAGTYGAVLLPIFAACWWQPRMKALAVGGCVASTAMVLTAGSGGPLLTYAAVLGALCFWPLRHQMRIVRWSVLLTLVGLHLVMKAPVWALIARIKIIPGASSYHRYVIVDAFMTHINEWWLIGVQDTASWGWFTDDVANYFCIVGKHAGLLGLFLFIRVLAAGFREVGLVRKSGSSSWPTEILVWAFGASLFAHMVSFWGTSYFDQTIVLWHLTLAMITSLSLLIQSQEAEAIPLAENGEEPAATLANAFSLGSDWGSKARTAIPSRRGVGIQSEGRA
jgi:hypothetical protein